MLNIDKCRRFLDLKVFFGVVRKSIWFMQGLEKVSRKAMNNLFIRKKIWPFKVNTFLFHKNIQFSSLTLLEVNFLSFNFQTVKFYQCFLVGYWQFKYFKQCNPLSSNKLVNTTKYRIKSGFVWTSTDLARIGYYFGWVKTSHSVNSDEFFWIPNNFLWDNVSVSWQALISF